MAKRIAEIVIRNERRPVPSEAFTKQLESLPDKEQWKINGQVDRLTSDNTETGIKGVGYVSALEILWSLGRLFERENYAG